MRTKGFTMAARTMFRATVALGLIAPWILAHTVAAAGDLTIGEPPTQTIHVAASDLGSRSVTLGVSKSVVIDLPRDIKDVLVADPKIANAVVRSSRRAYIIGIAVGQTNVFFFDAAGKQMAGFDIAVTRDLNGIRAAIRQVIPDADITIEGIGDGVILSGSVSSAAESQQAYDIAARLLNDSTAQTTGQGSKIVNAIVIRGRDQVMLKVTVAEVDRTIVKQLGINLSGSLGYGTAVVNFNNNAANPGIAPGYSPPNFPVNGTPTNTIAGTVKGVTATLQAMEQAGVVRTLAEPTLTAISGESAHFLAGGMFPYPSVTCTTVCSPTIQFQNFGVSLTFSPVVLAEGRISLNMLTEVSELNTQNSVTLEGVTVPGLTVRRADTTVEIPSGGSLAIAGMIQQETKQSMSGFPGVMELPILGPLFKSRDYLNNLTELVVIVTPYVVRAVAEKDLSRPDDGFADPSDPSSVLLGRLNRIYGVGGKVDPPPDGDHGKYGFILD
jgi:pilus assembly protein CpaC